MTHYPPAWVHRCPTVAHPGSGCAGGSLIRDGGVISPEMIPVPEKVMVGRKPSELFVINGVLSSGEYTHCSGIYKSQHPTRTEHDDEQEIFIPKGTPLPLCPHCGSTLQYRLMRPINSISEDPDFQ